MGKILWNSGAGFFNTVETVKSGFVGKSGNQIVGFCKSRKNTGFFFNQSFNTLWKTWLKGV